MNIEEIYEAMETELGRMREKAHLARKTAKTARKRGDLKKWAKFNAVARVWEMAENQIYPYLDPLYDHCPEAWRHEREIPF